jgi:hypothetical protein
MDRSTRFAVEAAAALAGGILTAAELRALGMSRSTADRLVAAGEWRRLASGIYVISADPPDPDGLARGAQLYGGPTAVVSGLLAATALRMRWIPTASQARLLVDGKRRLRSTAFVAVRRCSSLADVQSWTRDDVTYASWPRAAFDAALQLSDLRSVRGVVLGAIADQFTSVDEQRKLLMGEPRNGTALLRRALRDAERGCASPPEAELVDGLIGCRLPFLVNPQIYVDDVLVGCPDVWLVGLGCGSEMDSRERHAEDDHFDATLGRHDAFGAHGLVLSHLTPRRFRRDPGAAVAAVLAVARTRLALPPELREPPGLRVEARGPLLR